MEAKACLFCVYWEHKALGRISLIGMGVCNRAQTVHGTPLYEESKMLVVAPNNYPSQLRTHETFYCSEFKRRSSNVREKRETPSYSKAS